MGKLNHSYLNLKGAPLSPFSKDEGLLTNQAKSSSNNLKIISVDKVLNLADENETHFEDLAREYKF